MKTLTWSDELQTTVRNSKKLEKVSINKQHGSKETSKIARSQTQRVIKTEVADEWW